MEKIELTPEIITQRIGWGWNELSSLQSDLESLKSSFKGTKKVEDLYQGLIDAYLIFIGQLSKYAEDNDFVAYPDNDEAKKLKEDVNIDNIEKVIIFNDQKTDDIADPDDAIINSAAPEEVKEPISDPDDDLYDIPVEKDEDEDEEEGKIETVNGFKNAADYFVDFDEPDLAD